MLSEKFEKHGKPLRRIDEVTPRPKGDEILVRVKGCGVCHSDVHIWEGFFDLGNGATLPLKRSLPFTLGHEIAGTIEAAGETASGVETGGPVVVYPWIGCGDCPKCEVGDEHHCPAPRSIGVNRDGGYSTHVLVPHQRYCLPIDGIDPMLAATYACSGLTAFSALSKVQRKAEAAGHLLVIGAGGVGLASLPIASAMFNAEIIVADIDPKKREAAKVAGARFVVDPGADTAGKELAEITGGGLAAAVDFVGSAKSAAFGVHALGADGELVIVGLFGGAVSIPVVMFPLKRITLRGSFVGSLSEMKQLLDLVRKSAIQPMALATRPLDQANRTLNDLAKGAITGRMMLVP